MPGILIQRAGGGDGSVTIRGDGVGDNTAALRAALAAGGVVRTRGTLVLTATASPLSPAEGTVVDAAGSTWLVTADDADAWRALISIEADHVSFRGLDVRRSHDVRLQLVVFGDCEDVRLSDCRLDGASRPRESVALRFGSATSRDVRLDGCWVGGWQFGLLMASGETGGCVGLSFADCDFAGNQADDIELNSPDGLFSNVTISDCRFRDNAWSGGATAGFAVGVAHCEGVSVTGCTFDGYDSAAIHVEDRSSVVTIAGNAFRDCARGTEDQVITVLHSSAGVSITGNSIDARGLDDTGKHLVGIGSGGEGLDGCTAVTISGNTFLCGLRGGVTHWDSTGVSVTGNSFVAGEGIALHAISDASGNEGFEESGNAFVGWGATEVTVYATEGGLLNAAAVSWAGTQAGGYVAPPEDKFEPAAYLSGGTYFATESFLGFDTSAIPAAATVDSATVEVHGKDSGHGWGAIECAAYDFGTLAEADWRNAGALAALTVVASFDSTTWDFGDYNAFSDSGPGLKAAIAKGGTTRLAFWPEALRTGANPDEFATDYVVAKGHTGSASGTSQDPRLTVAYTLEAVA